MTSPNQIAVAALEDVLTAIRRAQSALSPVYANDNSIPVGVLADAYHRTWLLIQQLEGKGGVQ